jgi:2-dehydro-3-deoxyphosphogluconate aldolase/(4S)-4-hydroxy-2-oxoglutarate aldolase
LTPRDELSRTVLDRLGDLGVVPVVEIPAADRAVPLGRALLAAGLPCAEITFRTAAAADAIRALRSECPELLVGAGTILAPEQADAAVAAGASFLVAPGFNPSVVDHARDRDVPMVPGVCTPSEIERALADGIETLKFFPAEVAGGVVFLEAIAPVYQAARFIPTGGIGPANLAGYLALPHVLACGGSWMVKKELLAAGDFAAIERLAAEAVRLARSIRPHHAQAAEGTRPDRAERASNAV